MIQVPLLEKSKIDLGFDVIIIIIKITYFDDEVNESKWIYFMEQYVLVQWGQRIKKEIFCVFGQSDRTNNHNETNNNVTVLMIHEKPTCSGFVGNKSLYFIDICTEIPLFF